jgi:hypothetical protein
VLCLAVLWAARCKLRGSNPLLFSAGWLEAGAGGGGAEGQRREEDSTRFLEQSFRQLAQPQLNKTLLMYCKIIHDLRVDTSRCQPAQPPPLFIFIFLLEKSG